MSDISIPPETLSFSGVITDASGSMRAFAEAVTRFAAAIKPFADEIEAIQRRDRMYSEHFLTTAEVRRRMRLYGKRGG